MSRRTYLTDADRKRILTLIQETELSYADIGRRFGVCKQTIVKLAMKWGIKHRRLQV